MYYSSFGILSLTLYIIIFNRLLRSGKNREQYRPAVCYKRFLFSVMLYIITDIIWGLVYERQLILLANIDTFFYFLFMVISILMWTEFVIAYIESGNIFEKILKYAVCSMVVFVISCLVINLIVPILYTFDAEGVYKPLSIRYLFLGSQILVFMAAALYSFVLYLKSLGTIRRHYLTITFSGLVMTMFIVLQTLNAFLPFYCIGCLVASCLIHSFVGEEQEQEKNRKLSKALRAAEKSSAAKTVFLSNMSHDLRTPINAILGMDEIILRDCNDEKLRNCAENIKESATSLLKIISNILDFSKIEGGDTELVIEAYNMPNMLDDLYNFVYFRVEDKGLELNFEIDPNMPRALLGDDLKIKQVISNLLINAVKYTEKGKVIFRAELPEIEGKLAKIRYTVTDTGIGIKEEDKEKLFAAFEHIDTDHTYAVKGAGLGLAISSHLLQMMNSRLSVQSIYNMGSEFSFDITQEIADNTPIGENWRDEIAQVSKEKKNEIFKFTAPESRILLVDDTALNLEVICGLLEPTKIKIDLAESGEKAIEKFRDNSYDLVFMDYMMPGLDGIETLQRIKSEFPQKAEKTPIVSLTASAVQGEREHMLSAGFTDFMTKPVILSEMMGMLVKYLPDEKIDRLDEAADAAKEDELSGIPKQLLDISWLNVNAGIDYCGSTETYMMALGIFVDGIDEKAALLEDCLAKNDIELFTINVHAIKSSSLTVGIADLSAKAKELELAGKAGDRAVIDEKFPGFVNEYRSLKDSLKVEEK